MCGIAGVVSRAPVQPCQLEQLARMSLALIHRGPDGSGQYQAERMAMAMRRLSIIDLATGSQPLYDEEESLVLISNGEIYNYVELREQLRARGHRFKTGSDCEVILHLYQDHGPRCVHHLRGMFAFALWDVRRQTLLLARDRMGEKPLYLYEQDGLLVFASELKALLRSGVVPFKLEPHAIDRYFHYMYVPEPMTPLQGVRKLEAGHVLSVGVDPWMVTEECYWRMEDAPPLEGDPARLIRAELETASALTIRSDVPVGLALSGGLDSSAIAILAARKYPGTLHAFSAGYPGRPHSDERSDARALADHLRLPFHEVEIDPAMIVDSFPEMIHWQDDPIADLSSFGYWAIAKAARDHQVPVLLQGQGGDELFWGYAWVVEAVRQSHRKALMDSTRGPRIADYLEVSLPRLWPRRAPIDWLMSLGGLRKSWASYQRDRRGPRERLVFYDVNQHYQSAATGLDDMYQPGMRDAVGDSTAGGLFTIPLPWPQIDITMTRLICHTYLREDGIARGDRLSMASSVELRLPLVDYRLVETVIGLRKTYSDSRLEPKAWLKEATADIVPDWVRRRPKRGFHGPVRAWHRAIFAKYGHLLRDGTLVQLGILRPEAARAFSQGQFLITETAPLSFTALALEMWCRQALEATADVPTEELARR